MQKTSWVENRLYRGQVVLRTGYVEDRLCRTGCAEDRLCREQVG